MTSSTRRTVTVLGATGSVGRSTLDLVARAPERFEVLALTARKDFDGLVELARLHQPRFAVIGDESKGAALREGLAGTSVQVLVGDQAIADVAAMGADWTMAAIVGTAGLAPVIAALTAGRTVALANKEALISAGALMTDAARRHKATLLPVDSEHNAIFQCFDHERPEGVSRVLLTASGGPFREFTYDQMRRVTPEQAVAHPNWSMGAKISVDSATLMNKGLELIEAFHLFPLRADQLDAVIHPQSVIHSLVEYVDGSVLAQLGAPDMRVPIAHVLAYPERMETPCERLDLVKIARLDFAEPDLERFPALGLAKQALAAGGPEAAILNAANEIAVAAFLEGRIGFLDIAAVVGTVLDGYAPAMPSTIEEVLTVDGEARQRAAAGLERFTA